MTKTPLAHAVAHLNKPHRNKTTRPTDAPPSPQSGSMTQSVASPTQIPDGATVPVNQLLNLGKP